MLHTLELEQLDVYFDTLWVQRTKYLFAHTRTQACKTHSFRNLSNWSFNSIEFISHLFRARAKFEAHICLKPCNRNEMNFLLYKSENARYITLIGFLRKTHFEVLHFIHYFVIFFRLILCQTNDDFSRLHHSLRKFQFIIFICAAPSAFSDKFEIQSLISCYWEYQMNSNASSRHDAYHISWLLKKYKNKAMEQITQNKEHCIITFDLDRNPNKCMLCTLLDCLLMFERRKTTNYNHCHFYNRFSKSNMIKSFDLTKIDSPYTSVSMETV